MKARDVGFAVFGRRNGARAADLDAASTSLPSDLRGSDGSGAPSQRRLLLLAGAALTLLVVLGAASALAAAPLLTAPSASNVRYTTAHLEGEVNPEDHETNYHFDYVTDAQFVSSEWAEASSEGFGSLAEGSGATPVSTDIGGLTPGTTYHLRLVAENNEGERVEAVAVSTFETGAVTKPTVTIEPASSITTSSAHFSGTVEVNAPAGPADPATEAAYRTEWRFECQPDCGSPSGTIEADPGSHEFPAGPVTVEGDPTGLSPNQTYTVKLVAGNAGGSAEASESDSTPVEFTTPPIKPTIEESPTFNPHQTEATFAAVVILNNAPLTDCHFVYGSGSPAGHEVPCEEVLSASGGKHFAIAKGSGLLPNTEYSYRLLATNAAGTEEGPVQSFTTPGPAPAEACPNEAIREAQHSTRLPECRAYEQVSPQEKGDSDIVGDGFTNFAATDGEAVTFNSRASFGDTIGSAAEGQSPYIARRGLAGWTSHAIAPTPRPSSSQTVSELTKFDAFSTDLSHAIVWAYDLPGGGGNPQRGNVYLEDTSTRAVQALTRSQTGEPLLPFDFLPTRAQVWGISADAQHVALVASSHLLPEAAENFAPNVYQWDAGKGLSLAGILPDSACASPPCVPPGGSEIPLTGFGETANYRNTMSADGRRLVFTAAPEGQPELYMRIDGTITTPISQSEGDLPSTGVHLQAVTPDGRNVFFVTESALVPGDSDGTSSLYRWTDSGDAGHDGALTYVVPLRFDLGLGVVGVSVDGTRVYYQPGGGAVLIWDNGRTRLVTNDVAKTGDPREWLTAVAFRPGFGRVSPDGRWLAFMSSTTLATDGIHSLTGQVTQGHNEMYLYDLRDKTLSCVSCPSSPPTGDASITPDVTTGEPPVVTDDAARPPFLAPDGHVYFSTPDQLLLQDVNGVEDVYSYDPVSGTVSLLSTGRGSDPASFAAQGAEGRDVFISTKGRLAGSDTDELVDLYDVRSGGGFAEPSTPAPCVGETCRPTTSRPPTAPSATSTAAGPGNPHIRHRKRHHRRKHRHHHHKHHRTSTDRRAGK